MLNFTEQNKFPMLSITPRLYNYNSLHLNNLNEFLGLQHFLYSFNILNMCLMISCNYLKFLRF